MSGSIGPALPPEFATRGLDDLESERVAIGPSLPPNSNTASKNAASEPDTHRDDVNTRSYGPALPPGFNTKSSPELESVSTLGPLPPQHTPTPLDSEESEEKLIGPMPDTTGAKDKEDLQRKKMEIEARSQSMRDKLTGNSSEENVLRREEWMTELPVEFKPLGIGPRKFRTNIPESGDRSVWTDTPADLLRKAEEAKSGKKKKKEEVKKEKYASVEAQQIFMAQQVEHHNREHRSESLMDIHRKRRLEERNKGGLVERQPFDRERDLEAPRSLVTPAKRMALMKDSKQSLSSKFTHGDRAFL